MTEQPGLPDVAAQGSDPASTPIIRAFGAENRERLLLRYFGEAGAVTPASAWEHTYRLLLWIDRTTGLAHCYESDKCQPGRPWYARSLAFHDWVASALGLSAAALADEIDWLFKAATGDLIAAAVKRQAIQEQAATAQRAAYTDKGMPLPGEDPELESIILDALRPHLTSEPDADVLRRLTQRVQLHIGQENKRKNLVGEGFEDTVAQLLHRIPGVKDRYDIRTRPMLHQLPGFHPPRGREKPRQVDLALVHRESGDRTLVSCKWSVRSDREEQFGNDFRSYSQLEAYGADFAYVLVTNEFDPARLAAAADMRRENGRLFDAVVHVNTAGPLAAYSVKPRGRSGGITRATDYVDRGLVTSLDQWLRQLASDA